MKIEENINLSIYTSWKTGGLAEYVAFPKTVDDVKEAFVFAKKNNLKITVMGHGTNLLISDDGIKGLVINTRKLSGVDSSFHNGCLKIKALAGTLKSEILKAFLKHKLSPAIFLAGIPGDVGGGVVMNAGIGEDVMPREFVEITEWIRVVNGEKDTVYKCGDLKWSYRTCEGWKPGVIVEVGLRWVGEAEESILEKVKAVNKRRLTSQPLELSNCGSVFQNPLPQKAGALIEAAGLKGFQIGGAQISKKHANFIVNIDNATSADIYKLMTTVQSKVYEASGIKLKPEVVRLGF